MTITRRARLTSLGWDDDLAIETAEVGEPKRGQVLLEVEACGVCYRDLVDRDGRFPFIRVPITPGHEVVGRVLALGPQVSDWQVGDRVAAMHRDFCGQCVPCAAGETSQCLRAFSVPGLTVDGGYQTHMLASERGLFRVPDGIPASHAAIFHCTFGTAFRGLSTVAQTRPGDHVVVTGANGGVGAAAIQVARRLGGTVTAVVRDEEHVAWLEQLGAQRVLVDDGGRFHKKLASTPADVAIDCVGEPTFNAALRSLRPGGQVLVVGNVTPDRPALNLGYLVTRGVSIRGTNGANRADMAALFELHAREPFDVRVEELPLGQADQAQRRIRAGGLRGRLVLVPS